MNSKFILTFLYLTIFSSLEAYELHLNHLLHDQKDRTYFELIPEQPIESIVVVLHGARSNPLEAYELYSWKKLADEQSTLVIYPAAEKGHWNSGRKTLLPWSYQPSADDVGFLSTLVEKIKLDHNIKTQKIFIVGFSSGGMMVYRTIAEQPNLFDSAAVFSASLEISLSKLKNISSTPLYHVHGKWDPFVLFRKNAFKLFTTRTGLQSVTAWQKINKCDFNDQIKGVIGSQNLSYQDYICSSDLKGSAPIILRVFDHQIHKYPKSIRSLMVDPIWAFFNSGFTRQLK
jgi:poly(3-hydroxybutyrate) depolymerase